MRERLVLTPDELVEINRVDETQTLVRSESSPDMLGYLAITLAGGIVGGPGSFTGTPEALLATENTMLPPEVTTGLATTTYIADAHKVKR